MFNLTFSLQKQFFKYNINRFEHNKINKLNIIILIIKLGLL